MVSSEWRRPLIISISSCGLVSSAYPLATLLSLIVNAPLPPPASRGDYNRGRERNRALPTAAASRYLTRSRDQQAIWLYGLQDGKRTSDRQQRTSKSCSWQTFDFFPRSPLLALSDAPSQDSRASLSAQSGNGAIIAPCPPLAASRRPGRSMRRTTPASSSAMPLAKRLRISISRRNRKIALRVIRGRFVGRGR